MPISGIIKPMVLVYLIFSPLDRVVGMYPRSMIAWCTFSLVSLRMCSSVLLITLDTVVMDTPAARATSVMVGLFQKAMIFLLAFIIAVLNRSAY